MLTIPTHRPTGRDGIAQVLREGLVRAVYQPIVDLVDGDVVAYESLARGSVGSPLATPDELFPAAKRAGRLSELDRLCTARALEGAVGRLHPDQLLFVNVEPAVAAQSDLLAMLGSLTDGSRGVIELTERALTEHPAELLALVRQVRARGWGIALDDVGADPRSLALMALLEPDIIKLDLALVQQRPSTDIAAIVAAVSAYAEHSGAVVLAEGLESDEHVHAALAMGARYGQGWRFGRPGELPSPCAPRHPLQLRSRADATASTPFEALHGGGTVRRSTKPLLIEVSKHLEAQALSLGPTAVVLAAFQHARHFTPTTAARYEHLARGSALVGVIGEGMPAQPAPGVRGSRLAASDPIAQEWDIAVVSPHFAAALVARDLGDQGPQSSRRFDYLLTYDRDRAVLAAKALMERFTSPV